MVQGRLNSGIEELFVALKDDEVISMSLVFNISNSEFALLDYIAVSEHKQGSGIGTLFMQYLVQRYCQYNKQIILEVEDPGEGKNPGERQRRVNFYRRLGARVLQDVHYILPALDGTTSTKMNLMIFNGANVSVVGRTEIGRLLLDLYEQVYNKKADDPLVMEIIRRLPKIIKLQ